MVNRISNALYNHPTIYLIIGTNLSGVPGSEPSYSDAIDKLENRLVLAAVYIVPDIVESRP